MSEVKVNNGNIEDALKRFKRQCARNGVLQEVRKREHYEKPSVKRIPIPYSRLSASFVMQEQIVGISLATSSA